MTEAIDSRRALQGSILALCLGLLHVPCIAWAHGGGLDTSGCHTNRKTGDYHCHGANPASPLELAAPAPPRDVSYPNCTAVRNAGAAPIRRGDPGYGKHLDRDNDGVGCE